MTSIDLKLNNGKTIPALGLGTWQSDKGLVEMAVEYALKEAGIRHIDAAYAYQNEEEVGNGIAKAIASGKVKREDIFVTTKVQPAYHNRVELSLSKSLAKLDLDYVDLLLVHWPVGLNPNGNHELLPTRSDGTRDVDPEFDLIKTWRQFEGVLASGKVKSIGVSNFSVPNLELLLKDANVIPVANQIENHPLLPQTEVNEFCKKHGIIVQAYSPFGSTGGPLFKNETIQKLAVKYKVAPSDILINYHLADGRVVLPKSVTPQRILDNTKAVALTKEDQLVLENIHKELGIHRFNTPPWGVNLKFPDWNN